MKTEHIVQTLHATVSSVHLGRTVELLKAFTEGVIADNPVVLGVLVAALGVGLFKRSRLILIFLFGLLSIGALVHFTLPTAGELDLRSVSTFAVGWVLSTVVVIYLLIIR